MTKSAIVLEPSTITIVSVTTIGYASTITDNTIPAFIPVAVDNSETHPQVTTIWSAGAVQPVAIATQTVIDATYYLQNTAGSIYSTSTTLWTLAATATSFVGADNNDSGFDSWSAGAKAGLIIGVVFAALLILWLLVCCYKRNAAWVAHDWRWAPQVEGGVPGMANANMAANAHVMSPVTVVSTPSYSYGYPSYGYMRGGAGPTGIGGRFVDKIGGWARYWHERLMHRDSVEEVKDTPIRVLKEMREQKQLRTESKQAV